MISSAIPKDSEAFIVLYDQDLSSKYVGFTKVSDEILDLISRAWLAIIIYRGTDGKCKAVVISNGRTVHEGIFEGYVYSNSSSILKRDPKGIKGICV